MKQLVSMYRSAFPDLSFEVHETPSDGKWAAVRWTSSGTHEGELMGIEPTEQEVSVEGIELDRVEDGQLVESRVAWDALGLLRQVGAIPEPPAQRTEGRILAAAVFTSFRRSCVSICTNVSRYAGVSP